MVALTFCKGLRKHDAALPHGFSASSRKGNHLATFDALCALTGRCLIAALFLGGAVQKLSDPAPAIALLMGWGLPGALIWGAMVYNLLAGLALVAGVAVRPVALSLAGYCALTSFFHLLPDDPWQMTIFVKNWAIAGGCLMLAVHGAGPWRLRFQSRALTSNPTRNGEQV